MNTPVVRRLSAVAVLLAAVLCMAVGAAAQEVGEADGIAIRAVIRQQLDAFQNGNAEAAFSFASPSIRARFRTADRFMEMVRIGYPQVYAAQHAEFRTIARWRGVLTQPVLLRAQDGSEALALYQMLRMPDGHWRIDGCFLVPSPGSSA